MTSPINTQLHQMAQERLAREEKRFVPALDKYVPSLIQTDKSITLRSEINAIGAELESSPLHDELTENLRVWYREISKYVMNEDLCLFIEPLQRLLRDPISKAPFDENALLGNDGNTYDLKTLSIYLSRKPKETHHQFPLDPTNKERFFTKKHPHVSMMVTWLKKHNAYFPSMQIEKDYQALKDAKALPVIPNERAEKLRRIVEAQEKREQAAFERAIGPQVIADLNTAVADFDVINENMQTHEEQANQRLQDMEIDLPKLLQVLTEQKEGYQRESANQRQEIREINARIDQCTEFTSILERQNLEMRKSVNELNEAISKMEESKTGALIAAVAISIVCAFATYGISQALSTPTVAAAEAGAGGFTGAGAGGVHIATTPGTTATSVGFSGGSSAAGFKASLMPAGPSSTGKVGITGMLEYVVKF